MNYQINNLKIIVKDEVIDSIRRFYWSNHKYETGGILLGKFNKKNKLIEISEVYELKTSLFSKFCIKGMQEKHKKLLIRDGRKPKGK